MEANNCTAINGSAGVAHHEHSMGQLLVDHSTALSAVCLASLILGLPLSVNMLWHLRVATNASGRGVLRDRITFSELPFYYDNHYKYTFLWTYVKYWTLISNRHSE